MWARWLDRPRLLFSLTAVVTCLAAGVAGMQPILDEDVWWVAAAGRLMRVLRDVPRQNTFGLADAGRPWVMHEWAFAVPYDLGLEMFGARFFALVTVVSLVATLSVLLAATIGRARKLSGALLLIIAVMGLLSHRLLSARAANVALIFPVLMAFIAFAPSFGWRRLAAAVATELLWTNAHGSFPLGVILLAAAALAYDSDRVVRWAAVGLSAVATLVNPYGLELHALFLRYLASDQGIYRIVRTRLLEFLPLWRATPYLHSTIPIGVGLLGVLAAGASARQGFRVRGAVVLSLLAAGVLHVRHLELAALVGVVLLAPYVDALLAQWPTKPADATQRARLAGALLAGAVIAGLVPALAARPAESWLGDRASPAHLAARIPGASRAFIPFAEAGLALWFAAPRGVRVLFDPRVDCYPASTAEDAFELAGATLSTERAAAIVDRYGIDAVLVERARPLDADLSSLAGWSRSASDGAWDLWTRARVTAANDPRGP